MSTLGSAARSDIPRLVELLGLLFSQEREFTPDPEKQGEALEAILADRTRGRIFVARVGNEVVGMASLLYTISTAEGGKAALFEDLIVDPKHRGKGIGSQLIEYVIQQARAEGVLRITLGLYRKLGFVDSPMQPMRLHLKR
jgi:GNAT superfamily N-acetyltransferase